MCPFGLAKKITCTVNDENKLIKKLILATEPLNVLNIVYFCNLTPILINFSKLHRVNALITSYCPLYTLLEFCASYTVMQSHMCEDWFEKASLLDHAPIICSLYYRIYYGSATVWTR